MKTFIAPLLTSKGQPIHRPRSVTPAASDDGIYWVDELFCGGLELPEDEKDGPLLVLMCGPPGAGKSLFLQQLCYNRARRWLTEGCNAAKNKDWSNAAAQSKVKPDWSSLIITSETTASAVVDNLRRLGMDGVYNGRNIVGAMQAVLHQKTGLPDRYELPSEHIGPSPPPMLLANVPDVSMSPEDFGRSLELIGAAAYQEPTSTAPIDPDSAGNLAWTNSSVKGPAILVVDSLNVLPPHFTRNILARITSAFKGATRAIFLVADTHTLTRRILSQRHWEYLADVILRLDYSHGDDDYFRRSFEILKTRSQAHALGRHVVKIISQSPSQPLMSDIEGARPPVREGGIFVFPSVHFVLSQIRTGRQLVQVQRPPPGESRLTDGVRGKPARFGPVAVEPVGGHGSPVDSDSLQWPLAWCYELVGGGVPRNRCSALVGHRGSRKSYFAYQFLMDGVCDGEPTLLVSFRDNPLAAIDTFAHIANAEQYARFRHLFQKDGVGPRIVYQRPGYVTPEELLHRVIVAVGEHSPTRAVVNAIDHWGYGYPLLNKSDILLAALIDFFNTHGITSMVVGVDADGSSGAHHGLAAKAEVVLQFEQRRLPWRQGKAKTRPSRGPVKDGYLVGAPLREPPKRKGERPPQRDRAEVVVRCIRVPRGAAGYGRAVLRYAGQAEASPAGLRLIPLAPEYPEGILV